MLEARGMQSRGLVNQLEETFPPINPSPEDTIEKLCIDLVNAVLLNGSLIIWRQKHE